MPADLVADRVADDRGDDHHDQDAGQRHVPELGGGAGEQGHRLPREHEPDEERVLGEDDQAGDEQDQPAGEPEDPVDQTAHAGVGAGRPKRRARRAAPGASRWRRSAGVRRRNHPSIATSAPNASPATTSQG